MAARKDTPEMYEAFRMAEAERCRAREAAARSSQSGQEQEKEEQTPARSNAAGSIGTARPWAQTARGQDAAFYLPLGHRCQVVLSMSYQVAAVVGTVVVLALVLSFVFGMLVGGCERVESNPPASIAGGDGPGEPQTPAQPDQQSTVADRQQPTVVTPTPPPSEPVTPPRVEMPEEVAFRVRAVTVTDNQAGRDDLADLKAHLEGRGYTDIVIERESPGGRRQLVMKVGRFGENERRAADALVEKLRRESYKRRDPFDTAYVVRSR